MGPVTHAITNIISFITEECNKDGVPDWFKIIDVLSALGQEITVVALANEHGWGEVITPGSGIFDYSRFLGACHYYASRQDKFFLRFTTSAWESWLNAQ